MKVEKLNLQQWQELLTRFRAEVTSEGHAAMRIENTMFTPARYCGGMNYNGTHYTYFEPVIPDMPSNPDGSPYVAWLMVRDDFLKFAKREAKKIETKPKKKTESEQGELAL